MTQNYSEAANDPEKPSVESRLCDPENYAERFLCEFFSWS
jgi:hypothetical protein